VFRQGYVVYGGGPSAPSRLLRVALLLATLETLCALGSRERVRKGDLLLYLLESTSTSRLLSTGFGRRLILRLLSTYIHVLGRKEPRPIPRTTLQPLACTISLAAPRHFSTDWERACWTVFALHTSCLHTSSTRFGTEGRLLGILLRRIKSGTASAGT